MNLFRPRCGPWRCLLRRTLDRKKPNQLESYVAVLALSQLNPAAVSRLPNSALRPRTVWGGSNDEHEDIDDLFSNKSNPSTKM